MLAGVIGAAVVVVAAVGLIAWKVSIAVHVGPGWDTYAFLANAADFAGKGFGYIEPHRPPALPLLVSWVFRVTGELDTSVIQWVDGALTLSGVLAFYWLLRRRFDVVFAGAGALAILAVAPLWEYVGVGYTDSAAIAICTWLLLVLIKATEDNPAWFLLAGPLFVAATMTRFTAILFAFACLVWLAFRASFFRHAWTIAVSAFLGILVYLPAGSYYHRTFGDALFPFIVAFGFSENVTTPGGEGATSSALYYLSRMPVFLAPEPLVILTVFVLLVAVAALVTATGGYFESNRPGARRIALAVLGALPALFAQLRGGMMLRQLTIPVAVFSVWRMLAPRDEHGRTTAHAALDAVMLAWLAIYVDFHGHQAILVPRYFIPMALPIIYFVLRGWEIAGARLAAAASPDRPSRAAFLRHGAGVLVAAFVAASLIVTMAVTPTEPDALVISAEQTAAYLADQPGARDSVIYSDLWPLTAWYLRDDIKPMPSFETLPAYGHELAKSNADYFVTLSDLRFDEFSEVDRAPIATVLARSSETSASLPRIQYLGKSWDNYLEQLTGFDFYLMSTAGRYGWEGSSFLDGYASEDLSGFPAVAVYGTKWRSRADGEAALREYVERGGSVVFDASHNLGGVAYSMADTVAFDAIIRRDVLDPTTELTVDPAFLARHELDPVVSSEFVDEGGGVWAGASYVERPGTPPLQVIARAGDKPVIAYRDAGRGRIYFIGYNLAFHAFSKENESEAALIRAVFDDAIAHAEAATGTGDEPATQEPQ